MKIESIRLKNFKTFRDVHLKDIPSFLVIVGANGSGKSTLFDVFGFLHDCLKSNVRQALDKRGRFGEVLSRDSDSDTIQIEIQYRMEIANYERLVTYSLEISETSKVPYVSREILRYKRGAYGSPFHFLDFSNGEGYAINNEEDFNKADETLERENQKVAPDTLAIKGLGQFERLKLPMLLGNLLNLGMFLIFILTRQGVEKKLLVIRNIYLKLEIICLVLPNICTNSIRTHSRKY